MSASDIALYHAPGSRSGRTRMMLDLLGLEYTLHPVDMGTDEHKSEHYLAIHPFGLLPSLRYRGRVILDSGAQILMLADLHHEQDYAPPLDSPLRGLYLELFVLTGSLLEPAVVQAWRSPEDPEAQRGMQRALQIYEDRIVGPFSLGRKLTAADVFIHWGLKFFDDSTLQHFDRLRDYNHLMNEKLNWSEY